MAHSWDINHTLILQPDLYNILQNWAKLCKYQQDPFKLTSVLFSNKDICLDHSELDHVVALYVFQL